jgi:hypothetical protein
MKRIFIIFSFVVITAAVLILATTALNSTLSANIGDNHHSFTIPSLLDNVVLLFFLSLILGLPAGFHFAFRTEDVAMTPARRLVLTLKLLAIFIVSITATMQIAKIFPGAMKQVGAVPGILALLFAGVALGVLVCQSRSVRSLIWKA